MTYKSKFVFAVSLIAGWALTTLPALGQTQVLVTNTSAHPVPVVTQGTTTVSGTVNVGNMPGVNVVNTPTVSIVGSPTVTLAPGGSTGVTNVLDGQSNPKPLAVLDDVQPYQDHCQININNGSFGSCNFQTIPTGKRLVIEEVDSFGYMTTGVRPIMLDVENGVGSDFFPVTAMGTSNGMDFFASHNTTRIYSSNTYPECFIDLSGSASSANYLCHFSGFLVDTQ